jgi:hypothetical protein
LILAGAWPHKGYAYLFFERLRLAGVNAAPPPEPVAVWPEPARRSTA